MTNGLLTKSTKWHDAERTLWQLQDEFRTFDELLKDLSYQTTDAEYAAFMAKIRGKIRTIASHMLREEIARVMRESTPDMLQARNKLAAACHDLDFIRKTYGDKSEAARDAADLLRLLDAELENIIWLTTNHPEVLDAAEDDHAQDILRHGG